ncbi:MAG: lipid-A-disaccharide synthase [Candidatus Aureabacteria bacterium]|nr:lipid-A-disaccharide synthase [Candidatus Auribacterota bacterium]
MKNKKIFIVAGEVSGDIRGFELIEKLLQKSPDLKIDSVGGKRMKQAGANILFDITKLAVVGFVEVLRHYFDFKQLMNDVIDTLKKNDYSAIILIDYPGFNLRLAENIKHLGIPVIYYVSPQVWAWGRKRISKIAGLVDKMIVFFEFEKDLYSPYGLDTDFVGHPMVDMIADYKAKNLREILNIEKKIKIIGLLPGSRTKEVEKILPSMIEAIKLHESEIDKNDPNRFVFIISAAQKNLEVIIKNYLDEKEITDVKVYSDDVSDIMSSSDIVVVASGTATLQSCLFERPMIIVYKVAFLTWLIAKVLVKIPYIGMVNVISRKKIVPELIQWDLNGENILKEIKKYITDEKYTKKTVNELCNVKKRLGSGGAASKAASSIIDFLNMD